MSAIHPTHLFFNGPNIILLALFQTDFINLDKLWSWGPALIQLGLVLVFLIRVAPTWKEVRLRELDIRASEGAIREKEAEALGRLADVLQSIAVEQRHATETIKILQRVNADASDHLTTNIRLLSDRITQIEDSGGTTLANVAVDVYKLRERVEAVEKTKNVEPERPTAAA
jgi:hypothetical protein